MSKYLGFFDTFMLRRISTTLNSKEMRQFETDNPVTAEQERLLAFGAVPIVANLESCRTFRTKTDGLVAQKILNDFWKIAGREDALHVAENLASAEEHTPSDDHLYKEGIQVKKFHLLSEVELKCYATACSVLRDLGYGKKHLASIPSAAAWDYGRAGAVVRDCVQAGYLEEDEGWAFMEIAARNASQIYKNWEDYLAGYVFGRALGYHDDSTSIYTVLAYLLDNTNSPYQKNAFISILQ